MPFSVSNSVAPGAAANADIYVVPSSRLATITRVQVCNRSATPGTFRVAAAASGTPTSADYAAYDRPIAANDTEYVDYGEVFATGKHLVAYASQAGMTFRACGDEEDA